MNKTFFDFLEKECSYKDAREIEKRPGYYVALAPYLYTYAIIIGKIGDTTGFDNRWCYHSYGDAKKALDAWDGVTGEPTGWHRHPATGRRVSEDGEEYIKL